MGSKDLRKRADRDISRSHGMVDYGARAKEALTLASSNECKRRKIKCNGQTPCQRCGNLNLECVYAPNCCNSFKDTQDYKDMAAHIGSLQEQVNMLYDNLNNLRAQLGQGPSPMSQHQSQPDPIQQQPPPIDPSLQSQGYGSQHGSFSGVQSSSGAPIASMSPSSIQPKSQAALHGPTGFDYNVGVAKNSAQVIGAHPQADGAVDNGTVEASADSMQQSPIRSPGRFQASKWATEEKDPIWSITREEALRLCRVYEDEMGIVYPVVDISKVTAYANKLYVFLEAMHRSGLMQPGLSGPDSVEDEDTNVLKLVMATALTIEGSGRSELGKRIFEYVQPAVNNLFVGNLGVKSIQLKVLTVSGAKLSAVPETLLIKRRRCMNSTAIMRVLLGASSDWQPVCASTSVSIVWRLTKR